MDNTAAGSGPTAPVENQRTLLDLLGLIVRHRAVLFGLPVVACITAVALSFLLPRRYAVESRFTPESENSQASRLMGLAAQFGVSLGGAQSGESLDFYAELMESGELLRSAVLTEYRFAGDGASDSLAGNLVDLLEIEGRTADERVRNAVDELDDLVAVRPDPTANIISVTTAAPWPELAVLINQRLLELVNEFNLQRRQSRAAAERQFLEARVAEAERDLIQAEAAQERFLSENRRYSESPQLTFEHGRLSRRVDLLQQVYTTLAQGYETARVDEVRNTPVITVMDEPRGPARQTAPRPLVNGLLGGLLGILLAVTIVVVREVIDSARRRDAERFEEVRQAALETAGALHPSRILRRENRPDR